MRELSGPFTLNITHLLSPSRKLLWHNITHLLSPSRKLLWHNITHLSLQITSSSLRLLISFWLSGLYSFHSARSAFFSFLRLFQFLTMQLLPADLRLFFIIFGCLIRLLSSSVVRGYFFCAVCTLWVSVPLAIFGYPAAVFSRQL